MEDLDNLAKVVEKESAKGDDFVPEVEVANKEPSAGSMGSAAMMLQFVRMMIAGKFPYIEYEPEEWLELQRCLAVVLDESGGGLPEWLLPYQSHLKLAACCFGFGFSGYMQYAAHQSTVIDGQQQTGGDAVQEQAQQ